MLQALPVPLELTLETLRPLTFGAGTFSGRYDDRDCDPVALVRTAYDLGIRQFDTSPYYGDSESLLGGGIKALFDSGVHRENVFVMTKCGRYAEWDFDYSPSNIVRSVKASCKKLHVDFLDVVYLHDVEFVSEEQTVAAAKALFELKSQGIVRHVGISGYPLDVLIAYAKAIRQSSGQVLDLVLSYSHYNIQDTTLVKAIPPLKEEAGVRHVLNASPLSMGLLRSNGPPDWHPASPYLRARVQSAVEYIESLSTSDVPDTEGGWTMPNIALGFALRRAPEAGIHSSVIGFTALSEIHEAVELYWRVFEPASRKQIEAREEVEEGVRNVLGNAIDETWQSPPARDKAAQE